MGHQCQHPHWESIEQGADGTVGRFWGETGCLQVKQFLPDVVGLKGFCTVESPCQQSEGGAIRQPAYEVSGMGVKGNLK